MPDDLTRGLMTCIYFPHVINVGERAMATHSSTLAWKIPWTEEPGGLQSMGSLVVGHNWVTSLFTFHFHALEKEMATYSSVLAWRLLGTGEPDGLPSMGSHRVRHDWSDLAAINVETQIWRVKKLISWASELAVKGRSILSLSPLIQIQPLCIIPV